LVKAIKAMIYDADLMEGHNEPLSDTIMTRLNEHIDSYDDSSPGLICDYVLAWVLCKTPHVSNISALNHENMQQDVYCQVFDTILRHVNHPEAIPTLIWTLGHADLKTDSFEALFRIMSSTL